MAVQQIYVSSSNGKRLKSSTSDGQTGQIAIVVDREGRTFSPPVNRKTGIVIRHELQEAEEPARPPLDKLTWWLCKPRSNVLRWHSCAISKVARK
jgi:hypothetical protein